jgi:hypothetical protein
MPETPEEDYFLPCALLLKGLGLTDIDMGRNTVTVNVKFLRRLLCEFAKQQSFDAEFYACRYPDIQGACLAGEIASEYAHFIAAGYIEGRVPYQLAFDPVWYYRHYTDLATIFAPNDLEALSKHFYDTGHKEGRAGTSATLEEAETWRVD